MAIDDQKEPFAKRPFLPNFCVCPVNCEAYFAGVKPISLKLLKNFSFLRLEFR